MTDQLIITGGAKPSLHDTAIDPLRVPFVATPLGLLILLPLLVAGAAGLALWLYHGAMQRGIAEIGRERVGNDAAVVLQRAERSLSEVGLTLDRVHAWAEQGVDLSDPVRVARVMIGMVDGRPGVTKTYIGWSDGSLFGVARSDDGMWQVLRVVPGPDGSRRSLSLIEGRGLREVTVEERVDYDSRLRPWYQQAVASPGPVWTAPYRFASTGLAGVTVADALPAAGPGQPPRGVVAVDVDLGAFGRSLERSGDLGRNLIFTRERNLVAVPTGLLGALPPDRLASADDINDPVVRAFFASLGTLPSAATPVAVRCQVDGSEHGGLVQALAVPGGPTWYLAQIASREAIIGVADRARMTAMAGALVAVVLGILAGVFFARLLARTRQQVDVQRQRARAAEAKAEELGSYRLVRKLGEGGMGQVWIGEHRMLSRPAAVKLISPRALMNLDEGERNRAKERFEQEARITASLKARSTVELYDFGVSPDGTFYYVMELLDGMDLRQLVERHGPVGVGRATHILTAVLASLAEAHDRGLVHRDIKPDNIFICRRAEEVDVVKVLDFGLVRLGKTSAEDSRLTAAGMINGTPSTMAPEQAFGQDLDGRTDLYALGCVAFWLLSGQELYDGATPVEVITRHVHDPVPSLCGRVPGLPVEFARLIESCVAKEPAHRPADARSLSLALQQLTPPPDQAWTPQQAAQWWQDTTRAG